MSILLTLLGGSLGAISRYYAGLWLMKWFRDSPIPLAMVLVNACGSLLLGIIVGYMESTSTSSFENEFFYIISVGYLAAFTTFSTFSVEAMQLWRSKRIKAFLLYVCLTLIICLSLYSIGFLIVGN
jgi:CrcB protein